MNKKNWQIKKLGEVCDIYQPKTISKKDMIDDGEYFVFGANGIIGRYNKYNHENPELLVTCRGATCGSVNVSVSKSWINGNAMVVRPLDENILLKEFLRYFFIGIDLSNIITGSAQPQITRQMLFPFKISFPSAPEQTRIVEILDGVFDKIEIAKKNVEKNLRNSKELFESYLQGIFEKGGDDWDEQELKDVCNIESKLIDPRENKFLDLINVGAGNIKKNTGELKDLKTSKEEKLISGKFLFDDSMILYSKIRPYLMKVVRPDFEGLCSADIYPLTPKVKNITKDFLYHILLSKDFTEYAIKGSGRAGMPKVNRNHLFAYKVNLPPLAEQKQIARKLNNLSNQTKKLEKIYQQKIDNLDELKKSILKKAFEGEL